MLRLDWLARLALDDEASGGSISSSESATPILTDASRSALQELVSQLRGQVEACFEKLLGARQLGERTVTKEGVGHMIARQWKKVKWRMTILPEFERLRRDMAQLLGDIDGFLQNVYFVDSVRRDAAYHAALMREMEAIREQIAAAGLGQFDAPKSQNMQDANTMRRKNIQDTLDRLILRAGSFTPYVPHRPDVVAAEAATVIPFPSDPSDLGVMHVPYKVINTLEGWFNAGGHGENINHLLWLHGKQHKARAVSKTILETCRHHRYPLIYHACSYLDRQNNFLSP